MRWREKSVDSYLLGFWMIFGMLFWRTVMCDLSQKVVAWWEEYNWMVKRKITFLWIKKKKLRQQWTTAAAEVFMCSLSYHIEKCFPLTWWKQGRVTTLILQVLNHKQDNGSMIFFSFSKVSLCFLLSFIYYTEARKKPKTTTVIM